LPGWHTVSDTVTHTWSGPGTFSPQTGKSVSWTAPGVAGEVTLTVTADDSMDIPGPHRNE